MLTIHLHKVLFHAYHGVHEEETIVGGDYEVNASVSYLPAAGVVNELADTVNYVKLYEIVKSRMQQSTPLLETLVIDIADSFLAQFSIIEEVSVSIQKLSPPISHFRGSVKVSFSKKRKELQ